MYRPGLTFAKGVANGRNYFTEQIFPSPLPWVVGPGIIHPETNAPHGSRWLASAKRLLPALKGRFFVAGFFVNLA